MKDIAFWRRVDKAGGSAACWLWKGARVGQYGIVRHKGGRIGAHRLSWIINKGSIPNGMCVCHKCDNPICVNPKHLFLGTHADNAADCVTKGRKPRGETHGCKKLTAEDVRAIRRSSETQAALAARYGVRQTNISMIQTRQSWRHIT